MKLMQLMQMWVELMLGAIASLQECASKLGANKIPVRRMKGGVEMKRKLIVRSSLQSVTTVLLLSLLVGTGQNLTAIAAEFPVYPATTPTSTTATANSTKIPPEIVSTLRQDLSQRTGIPTNQLKFVAVSPQTWSDGCLGLAKSGEMCTQAMVNGWRVTFAQGDRRWVYRTNSNGRSFRLEPTAAASELPTSPKAAMPAARIPVAELPPRLEKGVVFRAIATGGFTGRTFQTTLYRNGKLVRQQISPNRPPITQLGQAQVSVSSASLTADTRQIPPKQVQQFMAVLQRNKLHQLNRADYRATAGSADFITTTFSCPDCTIRYADSVQTQLPANLQTVIQSWNELTRTV